MKVYLERAAHYVDLFAARRQFARIFCQAGRKMPLDEPAPSSSATEPAAVEPKFSSAELAAM
jgi:hypothetical protein